jgi:hypothetical protein
MAGHTILLARQTMQVRGASIGVQISLECTCGEVLHGGLFAVDDVLNQSIIRREGHDAARAHLDAAQKARAQEPAGIVLVGNSGAVWPGGNAS